ncbi:MAG: ABC transporter substrate-binding protein [Lachnospiraceae bacterium]|nr:ABC transporter substrate-binding protein [Lachnospiraceae bacterium]
MTKNVNVVKKTAIILFISLTVSLTSCGKQGVTSAIEDNSQNTQKTIEDNESFMVNITLEGGSGKASIQSPVEIHNEGGEMTATFVWTSKNYDYMIVNGQKYENENPGGESTFTVSIDSITEPLTVIGDTVAMSKPHEIEYVITWGERVSEDSASTPEAAPGSSEAADKSKKKESETDQESNEIRTALRAAMKEMGKEEQEVPLSYATGFSLTKYGDYTYVAIENGGDYLVVPEGGGLPSGLPQEIVTLQKPLDRTYLVSSSAMDLINTCGAIDRIRLSGTDAKDWYIADAKKAMEEGSILYAGKYRSPDYERILENECDLAIENTMIYHEPAVKAKLEELGIPVLVETSSYEHHPLGRLEWIKLYGVLFDRENEAQDYYEKQLQIIEPIMNGNRDGGKTVAFFHVTANGMINVRKSSDYISSMIRLSGGTYVPENTGESDNALATMNMQMEDFYREACEADIIIYNSTIGGEITSVSQLLSKNALFADFKAVREGRVYCTEQDLFQQITGMGEFMQDLADVLSGTERDYTYLNHLE